MLSNSVIVAEVSNRYMMVYAELHMLSLLTTPSALSLATQLIVVVVCVAPSTKATQCWPV